MVCAVSLSDLPFPLQAFLSGEGTDFCSARCPEGDLPGALQRLHGAAPAAPEPAGSGDRAQGTGPCLVPWLCGRRPLLRVSKRFCSVACLVASSHSQPVGCVTCTWFPSLLFWPCVTQSSRAGGGPWSPSRSRLPAAFQVNGRVVLCNGFHQSSALCTRVGLFTLGERGWGWTSVLETVPVANPCPLRDALAGL